MLNEDERRIVLSEVPTLDRAKTSVHGSNILFRDYKSTCSEKLGHGRELILGTASRLDEHKGIQYLIAAFAKLQANHAAGLTLLIAGDGSYRPALEALAKTVRGIAFLGDLTDVSELYNKIDIFIQPAEFEGWGRNVREAMLFGLPVLGSNVGGIKTQIKDHYNGLLFESRNTDELYEKLNLLVSDNDLRVRLGRAARASVTEAGDWEASVKNVFLPMFELFCNRSRLTIRLDASAFLSEERRSGVGYYSQQLVEALKNGANTELTTGPFRSNTPKGVRAICDRIYRKLVSYNLAPHFDLFSSRVDLMIYPNFSRWPTFRSRLSATVIHDLTYLRYPALVERKNLQHLRRVVPRAIAKSDFVIAVSESIKSELVSNFGISEEKVLVTPIPPREIFYVKSELDVHSVYSIPTEKYILFVGNLEPRKDIATLVSAYMQLEVGLRSEATLVIAGNGGWNNQELHDSIESAINTSYVRRIGYVDEMHISALYQKASVFVLPSLYEGFGMGILEAMAANTPVIASDIPAAREVGGNVAKYFPPKDFRRLSELLSEVLIADEPSSVENRITLFGAHLARFSWERSAHVVLAHTAQLLGYQESAITRHPDSINV